MPKEKVVPYHPWSDQEVLLLRELLFHTFPGGLNQLEELTWPEIVISMNNQAHEKNISSRVYTKKNVQAQYFDRVKPRFQKPDDEAKDGDGKGEGKGKGENKA